MAVGEQVDTLPGIRQHDAPVDPFHVKRLEKTLVLVNPAAGGGKARRAAPHLAALFRKHGAEADFVESRGTDDIRQRAAMAAASGYRIVAVAGGDGTLHHAVNGALAGGMPPQGGLDFAFFPAGNGIDIARNLGIPLDPIVAAHQFLRALAGYAGGGQARPVDLLRARFTDNSAHYYLAAGGLGLDAEAARLVNGRFRRLPGAARYVAAVLWALAEFSAIELEAQLDDTVWRGDVLFAAVANGACYGAGIRIEPAAKMNDGLLDVVLVGKLPLLRILEAIPILLRTGDIRWPEVQRFRARRVRLRPLSGAACFHGDGEPLGQAPLEVEVLPAAVRFIL